MNSKLIDILKYDLSTTQSKIKQSSRKAALFHIICDSGRIHLAKWMLDQWPRISVNGRNNRAFRRACLRGDLTMAQWLSTVQSLNINNSAIYNLFHQVVIAKHVDVLEWLYKKFNIDLTWHNNKFTRSCFQKETIYYNDGSFGVGIRAQDISDNYLAVMKWILDHNSQILLDHILCSDILTVACQCNNLPMVSYAKDNFLATSFDDSIWWCCRARNIDLAQWIIDNIPRQDMTVCKKFALNEIVVQFNIVDDINIVEWLLSLYDISEVPDLVVACYDNDKDNVIPILINYFDITQMTITKHQEVFNADIEKVRSSKPKSGNKI